MAATDEMCRVSIRTADHDVDLTMPAHIPIAELMPAVLDLIGTDDVAGSDPRLARLCGEVLDTSATFAQCAVPDGELLLLTSVADRPALVPSFDASAAVVDTVASLTRPWWPAVGRRAGWVVLGWAAAALLVLLGCATQGPNATRHTAIGAAAVLLTFAGAVTARRDRTLVATLGVLAAALAGLTAALASPGLAGFLLAMSATSAASLIAWRLLGCAPLVFLPLAAVTMAATAVTVGAVAGWWPTTASGPMLATAALAILAVAARLSVHGAGLSTAGLSGTDLDIRTQTARRRLTGLTAASAAAAALGTVVTAATAVRPVVSASFIAVVGAALLLRSHRQTDPNHAVILTLSAGIGATSLIGLCALQAPVSTPWLCAGLLAVGTGAVWFGHGRRWRLSPAVRGAITVLDFVVSTAAVPSAAAAAGLFAALPGIGQP